MGQHWAASIGPSAKPSKDSVKTRLVESALVVFVGGLKWGSCEWTGLDDTQLVTGHVFEAAGSNQQIHSHYGLSIKWLVDQVASSDCSGFGGGGDESMDGI